MPTREMAFSPSEGERANEVMPSLKELFHL